MNPWIQAGPVSLRRSLRRRAWRLALVLLATPLWALDPARPLDTCTHRVWSTTNGLPQDSATALLESRDGFLWIGMAQGLARWDGAAFTAYSRLNAPAFTSQEVRCLEDTPDGSIWIGTSQPGLFRLKGGVFTRFDHAAGLPASPILHLLRDRDGGLWAAPQQGPLLHLDGGRFQPVSPEAGPSQIRGLAQGAGGTLWVASADSGLWRLGDGRLTLAALAHGEITALEAAPDGQVWVGTQTAGLLMLEHGRLDPPAWARELPQAPITCLFNDREGSLWIGFEGAGLFRRTAQGRLERLPWDESPAWTPDALLEGSSGALWIATRHAGLHLLDTPVFQPIPTGAPARMVCEDGHGALWCLTGDHHLAHWAEGRPLPTPQTAGLTALWPRRAGGLWLGTETGGVAQLEDGRVRPLALPGAPGPGAVAALYEDHAGGLWIAWAHRGLWRYDPSTQTVQQFPADRDVTAFAEDRDGTLYFASRSRGLGVFSQGQVAWRLPPEAAEAQGVLALLPDPQGGLWVGTQSGLRRFQEGAFRPLPDLPASLQEPIHALLAAEGDHLWAATAQGVLHVSRRALLDGTAGPGGVVIYDQRDGLPSREPSRAPQPTAWRTREGDLLFATGRGLAFRDARLRPPAPVRFKPELETILVDDRPQPPAPLLRIPPGSHRLEISYTAACPAAGDRLRFRTRLEGFDPAWQEAGTRRSAVYSGLPPGTYRFRVQAWSLLDEAPPQELDQRLQVQPYLDQRPAFWILCGLALLAFAGWLHRLRLQQLEARSAVLAERNRMAREIHDHLAQGFTGVLLQMEAAEAQLGRLQGDPTPVLTRLEHARRLAMDSLQEARRSVMALRPRKPEGADLLGALQALADRLLAGTGIQAAFRQEGRSRPLRGSLEEDLIRMAQELMTNALRHGHARRLEVTLKYEARRVRLSIQDDGQGFDPAAEAGGYGLRSIRETLRALKGQIEVASRPGAGTHVTLILPVRRRWP